MRKFPYYLYHICRKQDKYDLSKGYIGVSNKPSKRWNSGGYKDNPHLINALSLYDDIIKYVIKIGTEKECLANEKMLRSERNMGWNIAMGGGKPPSPKGTLNCISKLPKEKRRKFYKHTDATLIKLKEAQKKHKQFHSERMIGNKNPMFGVNGADRPNFKGYYLTPLGRFETSKEVEDLFFISKETVRRRCKVGGTINPSKWQEKSFWGKTWESLGWGFKDKTLMGEKDA